MQEVLGAYAFQGQIVEQWAVRQELVRQRQIFQKGFGATFYIHHL